MKFHHLTVAEALASLQSGADGLSAAEAQRRLAEYGLEVKQAERHSSLRRFLSGFTQTREERRTRR